MDELWKAEGLLNAPIALVEYERNPESEKLFRLIRQGRSSNFEGPKPEALVAKAEAALGLKFL